MTNSPIKTKLVNLSERPFIASISSHTRIHLNPKGTQGDSITLNGDVFTQADRTPIAEALMESVLSRRIALYYSIDKVAEVTTNCAGNFNSSARLCDLIACFDLHPAKEEEKPVVEEPTAVAPERKEEPEVEEPAKEEEKSTKEAEPVQEPAKEEEAEKPAVEEPVTEPVTQEPEEVKPAKKKRQIKIN
jgi:hypothetical protein